MKFQRQAIICILFLAASPAATARGENRALFMLYNFNQFLATSYTFDSYYQRNVNGVESDRIRHAPDETYQFAANYAVYSPRLLRGTISLGVQGRQQFMTGQEESNSTIRLNYDITGSMFKQMSCPISFNIDSSLQQVNPSFSRGYDLKSDQYGVNLALKNKLLPANLWYSRSVYETSGKEEDRGDILESFGLSLNHVTPKNVSSTSASLLSNHAVSHFLSGIGGLQKHNRLSVSLTNLLQPLPGGPFNRMLTSSYSFNGEDGSNPGRTGAWSESLDWYLGKELHLRLDGEWVSSASGPQERQERRGKGTLEHRLLETVTTQVFADVSQVRLDTGTEESTGGGGRIGYNRNLPRDSSFLMDYMYSYHDTDSLTGADSIFYRDERLNVAPIETENYLVRNDVISSTIVVWNAARTRTYLADVDYTAIQDGRRTRLRIENGNAINIGDPISVDYSVTANPQVKYDTQSHVFTTSVNLWQVYQITAAWNRSVQRKFSGTDDLAPLTTATTYFAKLERVAPSYRAGVSYSSLDSNSANYTRWEEYWKYNREFDKSAVSLSLSDVLSVYRETVLEGSVSPGGNANQFMATAFFRHQLNDKLNMSVTGQYEKASGRSTDQNLFSTWFKCSFKTARLETELNARLNWRFYKSFEQRDFTTRIDLKRSF